MTKMIEMTEYTLTTDLPQWLIVAINKFLVFIANRTNCDVFSEIITVRVDSDKNTL